MAEKRRNNTAQQPVKANTRQVPSEPDALAAESPTPPLPPVVLTAAGSDTAASPLSSDVERVVLDGHMKAIGLAMQRSLQATAEISIDDQRLVEHAWALGSLLCHIAASVTEGRGSDSGSTDRGEPLGTLREMLQGMVDALGQLPFAKKVDREWTYELIFQVKTGACKLFKKARRLRKLLPHDVIETAVIDDLAVWTYPLGVNLHSVEPRVRARIRDILEGKESPEPAAVGATTTLLGEFGVSRHAAHEGASTKLSKTSEGRAVIAKVKALSNWRGKLDELADRVGLGPTEDGDDDD